MSAIAPGWRLTADVSPEWLFLVLGRESDGYDPAPPLTDYAWNLSQQRSLVRIIIELEANVVLTSHLVGQLVLLHRRVHQSGGVVRICSFSKNNYDVLVLMQLHERFYNYPSREAAVMGYRDAKH